MQEFLVIDDHSLVRTGLVLTLQGLDAQAVVYEAGDIKEALTVLCEHPAIDLVITDLRLPVIDGIAGLSVIKQLCPAARVVVITAQYTEQDVERAMERGAVAFVPKSYTSRQIVDVVRLVLEGKTYRPSEGANLDPTASTDPLAFACDRALNFGQISTPLTDRQMQVLALLVQGKSNKVIGDELKLASGTVKIHISALLRALHVTNRTQVVLAAAKLGLKL
jgi:DNA-binding NarL/FixJ family response regulator